MQPFSFSTVSLILFAFSGTGQAGEIIDCYCTDKHGSRIELGEMICLDVGGRMFMAQCQMSLNVPMWREISDGCASAQLLQSTADTQNLPATRL